MPSPHNSARQLRLFAIASFAGIMVYAFGNNILGPGAVAMMDYFGTSTAQHGFVSTLQALGELCVSALFVVMGERFNKIRVVGLGLCGVAFLWLSVNGIPLVSPAARFPLLLFVCLLLGIVYSMVNTMVNSSVLEVFREKQGTYVPLVHGFYSLGAMIGPSIITLGINPQKPSTFTVPYTVFGAMAAAIAVLYIICGRGIVPARPQPAAPGPDDAPKEQKKDAFFVFKSPKAWGFALVMIGFVAFNIMISVWLPTYFVRVAGVDFSLSGLVLTVFNLGQLVTRFLCPLILRRLSPIRYIIYAGIGASAILLPALFLKNYTVILVLVALCGLVSGAHGPCMFIVAQNVFPRHTASATAFTLLFIGVANMVAPPALGSLVGTVGFTGPFLVFTFIPVAASLFLLATAKKKLFG